MSDSQPPASQPPASQPPASQPPASQPTSSQPGGTPPASADTINQALAAVVAAFPPDSSLLASLTLVSNDDVLVQLAMVLNDQPAAYDSDGIQPVLDCIQTQFDTLSIVQLPVCTYAVGTPPPSSGSAAAAPGSEPPPASQPPPAS